MAILDKLALHAPHISTKQMIPMFVFKAFWPSQTVTNSAQDGTAWKKDSTTELVFQALSNGFTGIDTACQPKHYREDLVGEGLRKALAQKTFKRSDIYIQTKFTSVDGQDPNNIPYDPKEPITEQVRQSIEKSLKNFDVSKASETGAAEPYLDTVVLHSPMRTIAETMEVWQTLETYVPEKIRNLGISNCDQFTLMDVYERSKIKPAVVQNRFYSATKFDSGVRRFCQDKGIVYQSFWTLSANPELLRSRPVQELAANLGTGRESALYCLVLSLGNIIILNGTTKTQHMKDDFAAVAAVKNYAESDSAAWQDTVGRFRKLLGESRIRP